MNKFEAILLISPEVSKSILNDNIKIFEENAWHVYVYAV